MWHTICALVTEVQTCALPICHKARRWFELAGSSTEGRTQMRWLTAAAMALAAFAGSAQAQDFPTKPVTFVVPFSPGGSNDIVGRQPATQLSELWGQPVVVENRPGAGATVGPAPAAAQPAAGYTIMSASVTFTMNPEVQQNLPFH